MSGPIQEGLSIPGNDPLAGLAQEVQDTDADDARLAAEVAAAGDTADLSATATDAAAEVTEDAATTAAANTAEATADNQDSEA